MKNSKYNFKNLARKVLCILLCVCLLGTNSVWGAVQAFGADEHRYKLEDVTGTIPAQAAYGHVINYIWDDTNKKWQPTYQKVVTLLNWGLVGRGKSTDTEITKYFNWHEADATDPVNHLVEAGAGATSGDIIVIYDGKTVPTIRQTSYNGQTAFVDIQTTDMNGGALYNKESVVDEIKADFINNSTKSDSSNIFGGAIYNRNIKGMASKARHPWPKGELRSLEQMVIR